MSNKTRLDILLTERGLLDSRQKAQATIMSGIVFVNGQRVDKAGTAVANDAQIEIRGATLQYVSRGGLKLEKALQTFPLDLRGKICADIGASTGGFTDCMLQNGAKKVYAVDVGYGQLDWKLRNDERVVCMERTNARYLTREEIPDELDFASIDVSFISLKLIFPALYGLLREGGEIACLIKPQFEAGREKVGKKGVVRDPAVHLEVLEHFLIHAKENHFTVLGITYSPIRGPEGNIEYLGFLRKSEEPSAQIDLNAIVEASHSTLKERRLWKREKSYCAPIHIGIRICMWQPNPKRSWMRRALRPLCAFPFKRRVMARTWACPLANCPRRSSGPTCS